MRVKEGHGGHAEGRLAGGVGRCAAVVGGVCYCLAHPTVTRDKIGAGVVPMQFPPPMK